jgi:hypothetical protein
MLRSEVLKLYRNILRTVKKIPDEYYRNEMKYWARDNFENNKHLTDEVTFLHHYFVCLLSPADGIRRGI